MKTIKGILIDAATASIREVDVELDGDSSSTLKSMYKLLNCSCVDVGRGGLRYLPSCPDDDVWFDDEGAFREYDPGFMLPEWVPLIGNGLILGYDANGNCTSHNLTEEDLKLLRETVQFVRKAKKEG